MSDFTKLIKKALLKDLIYKAELYEKMAFGPNAQREFRKLKKQYQKKLEKLSALK